MDSYSCSCWGSNEVLIHSLIPFEIIRIIQRSTNQNNGWPGCFHLQGFSPFPPLQLGHCHALNLQRSHPNSFQVASALSPRVGLVFWMWHKYFCCRRPLAGFCAGTWLEEEAEQGTRKCTEKSSDSTAWRPLKNSDFTFDWGI